MKILKIIFIFLPLLAFCNNTFKDKLNLLQDGDYTVVLEKKIFYLYVVTKKENSNIYLDEMTILKDDAKDIKSFKNWAEKDLKKCSSHITYLIDLKNNKITDCYSRTRKTKIKIQNSDLFLTTLMKLYLKKIPDEKRQRIGSPPLNDEMDRRKIWYPPVKIDGILNKNLKLDSFETFWPKDKSDLSEQNVNLYFDMENKFGFPYWIQINTTNFRVIFQVVDSGKNLKILKNFSQSTDNIKPKDLEN